ncbi:MAG: hypothetical protein K2J46_06730, partial [Muribaculaceae bacterium]|nr:hypothetical protein [Muribaculaceae bacterium]
LPTEWEAFFIGKSRWACLSNGTSGAIRAGSTPAQGTSFPLSWKLFYRKVASYLSVKIYTIKRT